MLSRVTLAMAAARCSSRDGGIIVGWRKVDDEKLAALHRLRAAFGFVEIIEVISHKPRRGSAAPGGPMKLAPMVVNPAPGACEDSATRFVLLSPSRDNASSFSTNWGATRWLEPVAG